jgi:hypothetical protein
MRLFDRTWNDLGRRLPKELLETPRFKALYDLALPVVGGYLLR